VPRPIYTDPEIAAVGLTEAEARAQYGDDVAVGRFPWVANARAVMQDETVGWVKSIHETKYGELLGLIMVGPHVTDLIEVGTVAIDAESTVETVADGMAAHPTLSEAIKEAGLAALGRAIHANLDDIDAESPIGPFWEHLDRVPTEELWATHQRQKLELAIFARRRLRSQFARHGEAPAVLDDLESALDPDILTIGFARRFATYKRAGLLFTDIDRLARMLFDESRPVQVVFAGKAHPADRPGQRVIQEIFQRSRSPQLRGRVYILENYDVRVARFLVQGVDVWLNNPRRPLEASGTSGMKAAQNGVPNVSVLDGWWDEGYEGDNGWAIGDRETDPDEAAQDWRDSGDLYRQLEDDIIPRYYDRDESGIPQRWLAVTRRAMATALWRFSTTRMLHEYTEELYLPAAGITVAKAPSEPVVTEAG